MCMPRQSSWASLCPWHQGWRGLEVGSGLEEERARRVLAQCWGRSTHGSVAEDRGQQCAGPLPKFLKVSPEAGCPFTPDSKAEKL